MDPDYREKGDTWPKVLTYNCEKYGDTHRAMRHKHHGIWQPYTWRDYYLNVKRLALGLLSMGLEAGDKVLIVGDNAPEWYYAELATQAAHGVSVGAYSDLPPAEIRRIFGNFGVRFAVVQDQEQVDKFLQVKTSLPGLEKLIYWNYKGLAHYEDPALLGFREVLALGEKHEQRHQGLFEESVKNGKAEDVCAIVYTSGTTGEKSKAAVHTFETLRAGAEYHLRLDPWHEHDNVVPHLPPVWINEQWLAIGCHLLSACTLNFAEGPETQQRDTREIGPTIVFRGARLWESQAGTVRARVSSAGFMNRLAFRVFKPVGDEIAESICGSQKSGLFHRFVRFLADTTFFAPIRHSLGLQNARICYTTGTILSPDAFKFYHSLNLPLKNLYGTTEGGALSGARQDDIRIETVGRAREDAEVSVSDKGEIIYRQPGMFVGYYNDPDMTAEVLKDGWFHTGDSGFIRDDGHIVLLDKVEDLVRLKSGKTLAPRIIESMLRFSPYVQDAWVFGGPDGSYPSAVIVINYENVGRWAGEKRVPYSTFHELAQRPEVYDLVKQDIERVNRTLAPGLQVKKCVNLNREFDPDLGELTRNRKLRRASLEKRYGQLIEAIYTDKTEVEIDTRLGQDDERMGNTQTVLRIQSVGGDG